MNYIRILLILIASIALYSCEGFYSCLEGNGNTIVESRAVANFSGIYNASEFNVSVQYSEEASLEVQADENLQEYIKTYVTDNSLVVEVEDDRCLESDNIRITVKCPTLSRAVLSGSGDIFAKGFSSDYFTATLSGSGDLEINNLIIGNDLEVTNSGSGEFILDGKATNSVYVLTGSGDINARDFKVDNCSVTLAGSGKMRVNFISRLTGLLSGSGDIRYIGPDEGVNIRTIGSGIVIKD